MAISLTQFTHYKRSFELHEGYIRVKEQKDSKEKRIEEKYLPDFKYIFINQNVMNWIHVDIDLPPNTSLHNLPNLSDPYYFDKMSLPRPNFVIHNQNGAHLFWHLQTPFPFNATSKTTLYYNNIRSRIIDYLKGDDRCRAINVPVKNPFWDDFNNELHDGNAICYTIKDYCLDDFRPSLDETVSVCRYSFNSNKEKYQYEKGNRNCATYYTLKQYRARNRSATDDLLWIANALQAQHPGVPKLPEVDIQGIIRSVLSSDSPSQTSTPRNYGLMELEKIQGGSRTERIKRIKEHQQLGALKTAELKHDKTVDDIKEAIDFIREHNGKLTARAIAEHIGKTDRTVRSYVTIKKGNIYWKKEKSGN